MKVTNEPVDGCERENWLNVLPSSAIAIAAAITVRGAAMPIPPRRSRFSRQLVHRSAPRVDLAVHGRERASRFGYQGLLG